MVGAALGPGGLRQDSRSPRPSPASCRAPPTSSGWPGTAAPQHLVFCGSHAGVSIGEDGPSQMGLEDMALFRALNGSTVLYPCDAVSAERLTGGAPAPGHRLPAHHAAEDAGDLRHRTRRSRSAAARRCARAGGRRVDDRRRRDHGARGAGGARRPRRQGIDDARDRRVLGQAARRAARSRAAARETGHLVVVEDHWAAGGLGEAVAGAIVGSPADLRHLAVRGEPRSGAADELLDRCGISRRAIEEAVAEVTSA